MDCFKIFVFSSFLLATGFGSFANAVLFTITNNCQYIVWAATIPGGGQQLGTGQSWIIDVDPGKAGARIWARTGCNFDASGRGSCQTGDCGGVLDCESDGSPPNTLAEYALGQFNDMDFFDISLVDGFNVPMDFSAASVGCTKGIQCITDINSQCPSELQAPGGCNNACTVFKTNEYCCGSGNCSRTAYSQFFKESCPDAYSYPLDDQTSSTFTCPTGTNYKVIFCP